jgi:hypothetical protein
MLHMTLIRSNGLPTGLGYLEVDHRAENNAPYNLPRHFEADTYTCTHCSAVVVLNPARIRERYKCRGCNHHICDNCAAERIAGTPCKTMAQKYEEHVDDESKRGFDNEYAKYPLIGLPSV